MSPTVVPRSVLIQTWPTTGRASNDLPRSSQNTTGRFARPPWLPTGRRVPGEATPRNPVPLRRVGGVERGDLAVQPLHPLVEHGRRVGRGTQLLEQAAGHLALVL